MTTLILLSVWLMGWVKTSGVSLIVNDYSTGWWALPMTFSVIGCAVMLCCVMVGRRSGSHLVARISSPSYVAIGTLSPVTYAISLIPSVPPPPAWVFPDLVVMTFIAAALHLVSTGRED